MLWNYDVSDKEEAERMASLYGEDFTRAVEPGMEVETGRNLVRRCGNELGVATWEAYDFDPDTWTCETFSNREAAELWLSGSLYLDECNELEHAGAPRGARRRHRAEPARDRTPARGQEIRGHARAAGCHQSHGGRLRRGQGEAPGVEGGRPRRRHVLSRHRLILPR